MFDYSDELMRHFHDPHNVGDFDESDSRVGTGVVGSPACGDVLKIQILVDNSVIKDAKFKAYGCCSVIASGSVVTDKLIGKTLDQALGVLNTEIATQLDLPKIKVHCSMIAEKAIKAAVEDYREKNKQ